MHAPDGSRYLFALEVYNGIDTKRVYAQLEKHLVALGEGRISELYGYPKAHRVLCVFETESALQAAVRRLCEDAAFTDQMRQQFAFSTLAELAYGLCRLLAFPYARSPDDLRQLTTGIAGQRSAAGGGAAGGVTSPQVPQEARRRPAALPGQGRGGEEGRYSSSSLSVAGCSFLVGFVSSQTSLVI